MTEGTRRRDEAVVRVIEANQTWADRAMRRVIAIPFGTDVSGEDVREVVARDVGQPEHHNAWGALILRAVRQRILIGTDRYVNSRSATSHARRIRMYVRASPEPIQRQPIGRITRRSSPGT